MPKEKHKFERIAFVASEVPEAIEAQAALIKRYGETESTQADAIVALGGDGQGVLEVADPALGDLVESAHVGVDGGERAVGAMERRTPVGSAARSHARGPWRSWRECAPDLPGGDEAGW